MSRVILGGGLSGLSAAYYLAKKTPNQTINLIESSSRTGGWIKSNLQENGVIFEQGPRTIRPRGEAAANTLKLIEELNLSDQIIPILSSHPVAKNRMIYANSALHLLPSSLLGLFKKQEPFSKPLIIHFLNDLKANYKQVQDESIYSFAERRFGREVADYLVSPMICGICAGNAQEVSVKFLMKKFFEYEQEFGNVSNGIVKNFLKGKRKTPLTGLALKAKKERWSIYSFFNGCETLPLALKNTLLQSGVNIKLNTSCKAVKFDKNQVTLELNNGELLSCDHLISSVPANVLGTLLTEQHPDLANSLKNMVKNVSVAVVNLQFKENFLKNPAFGLLVAPKEKLPILGIIFDSHCFPTTSGTVLTVMMGGYWFEEHFGKEPKEEAILDIAINKVKNILKIQTNPDSFKVNILNNCLPQYIVGHDDCLNFVNDYVKNHNLPLSLCGASYYGVGINDVILSAKNVVDKLN